jgi:hypothetical protein
MYIFNSVELIITREIPCIFKGKWNKPTWNVYFIPKIFLLNYITNMLLLVYFQRFV